MLFSAQTRLAIQQSQHGRQKTDLSMTISGVWETVAGTVLLAIATPIRYRRSKVCLRELIHQEFRQSFHTMITINPMSVHQ